MHRDSGVMIRGNNSSVWQRSTTAGKLWRPATVVAGSYNEDR
jgi:hypothetical protein